MILIVYLPTLIISFRRNMKLLILFAMGLNLVFAQDKAEEIVRKVRLYNQGYQSEVSEMSLLIEDEQKRQIERKLKAKTIEINNDEVSNKSIIEFVSPQDVKGTKLLTWLNKKEDKSQWIFLPALKKKKRILSGNQNSSFMGSEFTYEDIGGREIELYSYKLIKEDKTATGKTWTIEQVLKNDKSQKMIIVIDEKLMSLVKAEYLNSRGEVTKVSEMKNFESFKVGDKLLHRAKEITMHNKENLKSSTFKWSKRDIGGKVSGNEFNPNLLDRP